MTGPAPTVLDDVVFKSEVYSPAARLSVLELVDLAANTMKLPNVLQYSTCTGMVLYPYDIS